jgi:DNA-binding GntR family transcriptional regulator
MPNVLSAISPYRRRRCRFCGAAFNRRRRRDHRAHQQIARHEVAVAAAREADREAAAAGMTAQADRTAESAAAQEADEVGEIVLELPDIIDVAATPPGR